MAKEPKTYKLDTDLITKLEILSAQSGAANQSDFFDELARVFEMHQLKEGAGSGYKALLTEWEYHKSRDYQILVNIIESEAAAKMDMGQQHEQTLAARNEAFLAQEQTISEQALEIRQLKEENKAAIKVNSEHEQLIEQLRDSQRKGDSLIQEYREKNDTLTGLLNESKAAAAESKKLAERVAELEAKEDKHVQRIGRLEKDIADLEKQRQEQLKLQAERHEAALQQQQGHMDLQRERELVQLKGEYQDKFEKLSTEATERYRVANEQANNELKQLYKTIDELRTGISNPQNKKE